MSVKLSKKKQIAAAPKFGLYTLGAGWLASEQPLAGINFTLDKAKAMQFAVGFDNPSDKLSMWTAQARRVFANVTLEIVIL